MLVVVCESICHELKAVNALYNNIVVVQFYINWAPDIVLTCLYGYKIHLDLVPQALFMIDVVSLWASSCTSYLVGFPRINLRYVTRLFL